MFTTQGCCGNVREGSFIIVFVLTGLRFCARWKDTIVRTCSKVPACWWTGILSQGNREVVLATHIFGRGSVCCNLILTATYISPAFINAKPQKCLEGPECLELVLCISGIAAASLWKYCATENIFWFLIAIKSTNMKLKVSSLILD